MNDRTENHNKTQCIARTWCDLPNGHTGEPHGTDADLPTITGTACREDFVEAVDPAGIAVPEVLARLVEHEDSNTFDRFSIQLIIERPDGDNGMCHLNLHEAGLLAKALTQLRDVVRSE